MNLLRRKKMFEDLIFNRLTDEQKAFVSDFDNSILVSASAGTGKTTTMIRKILYLLLEKRVDISSLLVVTYTTAAASKMKHDLLVGLQSALHICTDEDMAEHISKQIDLIGNSDIGTIHAFCNKIIKKYFYQLGIDPNYTILSNEKTKNYLMNSAMSDVLEESSLRGEKEFFDLYESFNSQRSDDKLRSAVLALYEYMVCRINSDKWLDDCMCTAYSTDSNNPVWQYLLDIYKSKWQEMLICLQDVYDMADVFGEDKAKAFAVSRIDVATKLMDCNSCFDFARVLNMEKVSNKPTIKVDKDPTLCDLKECVENVTKKFQDLRQNSKKIFDLFIDESFEFNLSANKNNALQIIKLYHQLIERYSKIKVDNNLLDFNDLEHYAYLLCRNDSVLAELRNDYSYIFVDEYQDVNYIQDNIVSSISNGNNLYMIGDVKQSIYRFRQSCPEIFLSRYNDYRNGVGGKRLILFNKNFRSDKNVIGVVNNIFDCAITKDCVGIDYRNEARLVSGLEDKTNEESATVHLSLIDVEDINEYNSNIVDDGKEEVTKREYEAKLIASKVAEVVDKGYKFSDIAILLRDKKDLAKSVWVSLKKYNVPVSVVIKGNIFKSNEIQVLLSFLQCVYNEADDIAFTTLLKSPLIRATDNDLAEIRINAPDAETYYDACLIAEQNNQMVGHYVTKLRQLLKDFRLRCLSSSVSDNLREFVINNRLDTYYKSMPDGIEKECYINEFLNIIDDQTYNNDLGKLLDYLDLIRDKESEITISGGSDSVTLMTMHSSKGLDFPVVIVGGFGDSMVKNTRQEISINKDFGIAVVGVQLDDYSRMNNINEVAIRLKNKKEEFEESVRLMYVALTRPKKELYMTGVVNLSKVKKLPLLKCQTYFDILLQSVSDNELYYFVNKKPKFQLENNGAIVDCEIAKEDMADVIGTRSQIVLDVSNPEIVGKLRDYHNREVEKYPYISFKNSVSSILREQEVDYTNVLERFTKLETTEVVDNITAMELGTQYHTIMQYLDYNDEKQDVKKLVEDLVFENKLNAIYLNKIKKAKQIIKELANGAKISKEENFLTLAPHSYLISGSAVKHDVLVQGVIDLSIDSPNGAIIVDFKTNKTQNRDYLIATYKTQLDLYAKSYELAYNRKVVHKYLYSFELGELIEVV